MGSVSIQQALTKASKEMLDLERADWLEQPVYLLISAKLFEIANNGGSDKRGALTKAVRAQRLILNRMAGLRAPGTQPVKPANDTLDFVDLTAGALPSE